MFRTLITALSITIATGTVSIASAHDGNMTFKQAHSVLQKKASEASDGCTTIIINQGANAVLTGEICLHKSNMMINYHIDRLNYKASVVYEDYGTNGSIDRYISQDEYGVITYLNDHRSNDKFGKSASRARKSWAKIVRLLGSHVE